MAARPASGSSTTSVVKSPRTIAAMSRFTR
jgi:hypothetical protein